VERVRSISFPLDFRTFADPLLLVRSPFLVSKPLPRTRCTSFSSITSPLRPSSVLTNSQTSFPPYSDGPNQAAAQMGKVCSLSPLSSPLPSSLPPLRSKLNHPASALSPLSHSPSNTSSNPARFFLSRWTVSSIDNRPPSSAERKRKGNASFSDSHFQSIFSSSSL